MSWPSTVPLSKKLLAMRLSANPWPMRIIWIWNFSRKLGVHMTLLPGRYLYCQSQYRKVHGARINPRQHAHLHRTPEEMADKEIVKCMFIDEPEILDATIEKIPAEFYERYPSTNLLLSTSNSLKECRQGFSYYPSSWKLDWPKMKPWRSVTKRMTAPCWKSLEIRCYGKWKSRTQKKSPNTSPKQMMNLALPMLSVRGYFKMLNY